jgi:hypothetical protein
MENIVSDEGRHIGDHHVATSTIQEIVWELQSLTKAFAMTGNTEMASNLRLIAKDLGVANEQARNAFSGQVNDHLTTIQQGTDNMMRGILVAGALATGDPERAAEFAEMGQKE